MSITNSVQGERANTNTNPFYQREKGQIQIQILFYKREKEQIQIQIIFIRGRKGKYKYKYKLFLLEGERARPKM